MSNDYRKIIRKYSKDKLSDVEVDSLIRCITSYRRLDKRFTVFTEAVCEEIFQDPTGTSLCYPIDLVELRSVLKEGPKGDVRCYLDYFFAKSNLLDYSIFLGYETKAKNYGKIYICYNEEEKPLLKKVYLREYLDKYVENKIYEILKEEEIAVDVELIGYIPGLKPQSQKTEEIKVAGHSNVSPGTHPAGYNATEGQLQESQGIVYLDRSVETQYQPGKRVRLTVTGLAGTPIEGVVSDLENNIVTIKWISGKYKGKKTKYDLTDPISLSKINVVS